VSELADSVLVIASGNPLRGDDGVGAHVLDALRDDGELDSGALPLRLWRVQQLVPELAETVSRCRGVVFVDARADSPPGVVRCEPVAPGAAPPGLSHVATPATLLLYAERLFGRAPRAAVVTIGGAVFDLGKGVSPEALGAISKATALIRGLARAWARRPSPRPGPRARPSRLPPGDSPGSEPRSGGPPLFRGS
jgi:hydrogenase maturation protease